MPSLKAIVFDMDGTLADTEEIHRLAFNKAFVEFDLEWRWSPGEYHDLLRISGGRERLHHFLGSKRVVPGDGKTLWDLADAIHHHKSAIYRELLAGSGISLRPGVERLITQAREDGLKLAIATSSSRRNVETLLAGTLGTGGVSLFQSIITCDAVPEKKPSPAAFRAAVAELGLRPVECMALEDTRNGNLAAIACGLKTVITTHAYTIDNDFRGASLVVDHLGEPDYPCHLLAGDLLGAEYVDVPLLRRLNALKPAVTGETDWTEQPAAVAK